MAKQSIEQTEETVSPIERLRSAFATFDAAASAHPINQDALKAAREEMESATFAYDHTQSYDAAKEPVMAQLLEKSKSRDVFATRLLIGPTTKIRLYQKSKGETPLHDEYVGVNGCGCLIPRGIQVTVPQLFADILEQSGRG